MEMTTELKEYAELILEDLKVRLDEAENRNRQEEEVEIETDNPELSNVRTIMKISGGFGMMMEYRLLCQSKTILGNEDDNDPLWIYVSGKSRWSGKIRWHPEDNKGLVDEIAEHIRIASASAEELIFDKSVEQFVNRTDSKAFRMYRKERLRHSIFADKQSFKSGNMCCVCNEHTTTKTPCGHELCLVCWEQIQGNKTCPLCRHEIRYRNAEID